MIHLPFVLLAVLGMLPATLLPVVTVAVRGGLGFSAAEAGVLSGAIILSAAIGALAMARGGVPARWKRLAVAGLLSLAALEAGSALVAGFLPLLGLQMLCGAFGGAMTGLGYAAMGRAAVPDRLFGALVSLQFLIGGIGVVALPTMVAATGAWLLFAIFAAAAILVLLLVSAVPAGFLPPRAASPSRSAVPRGRIWLGFAALFLTQAGHSAGSVFILDFGRTIGLAPATVQAAAGLGGGLGVVGAIAAMLLGTRYGRRGPVVLAGIGGAGAAVLLFQPSPVAWLVGCTLGSVAWAYSVPYILGACVAVAPTRDDAMWLSFVAKVGLAAGPFAAALVVTETRFAGAIVLAALLGIAGLACFLRLDARPSPGAA